MEAHLAPLIPLLAILIAGVISATFLPRIGLPAIFGFFASGVLIGPFGLGLVPMSDTVALLAEFGVIFLLFDIGLHFSLKQLLSVKDVFLRLGPLQWGLSTALIGVGLYLYGFEPKLAVIIASALALSSTAVALQTMRERGERGTPLAASATALLIFQDVIAIVLLAIVGASAGSDTTSGVGNTAAEQGLANSSLLLGMAKALAALVAVAVLGRLIRPAFRWITHSGSDDAFTAAALTVVVLTAGATGLAGLSLPLGAFLGGMLLSESEYCYMIKTELKPFRGLLLGLFFITVGMSLDLVAVQSALGTTLLVAAVLLLVKTLVVIVAAKLSGSSTSVAVRMGFLLAQGSEFAFVIFGLMTGNGSLSGDHSAVLVGAVVISMAATPLLAPLGERLSTWIERQNVEIDKPIVISPRRVLLNGATPGQLTIAKALIATGHHYLALDTDPERIANARALGFSAGFGNLLDARLIESLSEDVDILILGRIDLEVAMILAKHLRQRRPSLSLLMRVDTEEDAAPLRKVGVVVCVAPDDPDDKALASETLRYLKVDEAKIERWDQSTSDNPVWEAADKAHAA